MLRLYRTQQYSNNNINVYVYTIANVFFFGFNTQPLAAQWSMFFETHICNLNSFAIVDLENELDAPAFMNC